MPKKTIFLILLFMPIIFPGCIFDNLEIQWERKLDVYYREQRYSNWCWAACNQMILGYYTIYKSQCEIVNDYLQRQDCCQSPLPVACNEEGYFLINDYNFSSESSSRPLDWEVLREQIVNLKKPIYYERNLGSYNHSIIIVAVGESRKDGTKCIGFLDPREKGLQSITYDSYVERHYYTYYNITSYN